MKQHRAMANQNLHRDLQYTGRQFFVWPRGGKGGTRSCAEEGEENTLQKVSSQAAMMERDLSRLWSPGKSPIAPDAT
eukprot:1161643-Pelagomonas_calceolata.AAC.7